MLSDKAQEQSSSSNEIQHALASLSSPLSLFFLFSATWTARVIQVAARLGIADLLVSGPQPLSELARMTQMHAPSLFRLLRTLSAFGIFEETTPGIFAQTDLSGYLSSKHPESLLDMALFLDMPGNHLIWQDPLSSFRTGKSASHAACGTDFWTYVTTHPQEYDIFSRAMTSFSNLCNAPLLQAYDFSSIPRLVDVGGSYGNFLLAFLDAYPSHQGILFDSSPVIEQAQHRVAQAPSAQRCTLIAGDFFDAVPAGADAYFLKFILHDWDDDHCIVLLKNCFQAMPLHGRLLVAEQVLIPTQLHPLTAVFDMQMLVATEGGRERTTEEFQTLFAAAGFELKRIISTTSILSLLEGVKR